MTLDIIVEALIPHLLVQVVFEVEEIGDFRPTLVADHHVQSAHCIHRLRYQLLDVRSFSHVALDGVESRTGG